MTFRFVMVFGSLTSIVAGLVWFFTPQAVPPILKAPDSPYRGPPVDPQGIQPYERETVTQEDVPLERFNSADSLVSPLRPLDFPPSLGPPASLTLIAPSNPYIIPHPSYHQRQ